MEDSLATGSKRTLPADVGHIRYGYVATSIGGQGKTVDRVFAAMGRASLPAVKAEQFYTDLSRARHQATLYTDASQDELREAIRRTDRRRSATELMTPAVATPSGKSGGLRGLLAKARDRLRRLRAGPVRTDAGRHQRPERGVAFGR